MCGCPDWLVRVSMWCRCTWIGSILLLTIAAATCRHSLCMLPRCSSVGHSCAAVSHGMYVHGCAPAMNVPSRVSRRLLLRRADRVGMPEPVMVMMQLDAVKGCSRCSCCAVPHCLAVMWPLEKAGPHSLSLALTQVSGLLKRPALTRSHLHSLK